MKILYIMGLGRSGSTLLDVVLGNHPAIRSVGQFSNFVRRAWIGSALCSCGKSTAECEFWTDVRRRWQSHVGEDRATAYETLRERYERMSRLPVALLGSSLTSRRFSAYVDHTLALYQAVCESSGKRILVDSSKVPLRAYHLARIPGVDLRILHLVRDARAVAYSWNKPDKRGRRPAATTAVDWLATHSLSEWVLRRCRGRARSLRVRYEDFAANPDSVLHAIADAVDESMDPVLADLQAGRPMAIHHMATGNRIRFQQEIRLKPDLEWRTRMPIEDQVQVRRITWPLLRRYGYLDAVAGEGNGRSPAEPLLEPDQSRSPRG